MRNARTVIAGVLCALMICCMLGNAYTVKGKEMLLAPEKKETKDQNTENRKIEDKNTENEEEINKGAKKEDTSMQIGAPSALLMEASTGTVLFEQDADTKRPPASVTKIMTMLLIFALVIVISSIAIFTYIYSGYHFHKNVFTDQGYLTNTLPVTPSQLLLSKELAALLWLLIDVVVISISIFILVGSTELFSNFSIFWSTLIRYASQTPLFTTLIIIALVLSPFLAIGILFFSITLGNLASSHKVLASIGAYVGIYVVQQIFGLIQLVVWGYFGSTTIMRVNIYSNNYSFETFLNPILITGLIFNIILIAVCWMGSKYIMTKRLNLQ